MSFNPVSSKKLYLQIYNQILSGIQSGSFKVGNKLPTERELCEQFGVSRAPIRQALSALELNGIIYSRQGEGVYVKSTNIVGEGTQSTAMLESISPEDIIEARMNMEPLIAKFAAISATAEDIENMRLTIAKMEQETKSGVYVPETDEMLHSNIAKASHNELFIKFMSDISSAMKQQEIWKFIRDRNVTISEYRAVNFDEHRSIIKAIEEHDAKEAEKIMSAHMQNLNNKYWKE